MEEIKRISRDLVAHGAIIDYYQIRCRFRTDMLPGGTSSSIKEPQR